MPGSDRIFEIHPSFSPEAESADPTLRLEASPPVRPPVLAIAESEGLVNISLNPDGAGLGRAAQPDDAILAVRVVRQRRSASLALLPLRPGVLVNGVPIDGLAVLTSADSLLLAPGWLCHVTERVRPYVGAPPEELRGKKCPFCMLPLTAQTRILVCRCGAPYHHETAQSHPETAVEERLSCLEKVKVCLSCSREIAVEEYLVWDPRSL